MAEIFDVMMMAKELGLTHIGNGEVAVRVRERIVYNDHQRNDHKQRRPYHVRRAEKLLTERFLFHSLIPPRPQ